MPQSILDADQTPTPWWRSKRWILFGSPLIFLLALLGFCEYSRRSYVPVAAAATQIFHQRLAQGDDELIYDESDQAFKTSITEETLHGYLSRIRRKLGACGYTQPAAWRVTAGNGGVIVTLDYLGYCTDGQVQEELVWRIANGTQARLLHFGAASNQLLTD